MNAEPAAARDALHALCLADTLWAERYRGFTALGHGASASVVRTLSLAQGEEIALKIFQRLEQQDLQRFQQEVRHSQCLASPFVVRTFSPFMRGSLSWIEMEWVDGPDLRHELQRREREAQPFALDEALRLGAGLAEALVVAHASGVIHRDVKPANVLLPKSGAPIVKLGDFGISRVAGAARVTATGLLAGTPQFAAPELVAGQGADACSDVYGLALVLYLVLSGNRFPFDVRDPESPGQWLRAHADARPRRVRELRADTPAEVDELLLRALDKQPARRPSAAEFLATLDPQRTLALSTVRVALPAPVGKQRASLLAALVLLVVLGYVVVRTPRVAAPVASAPARVAPNAPAPASSAPLEAVLAGDLLTLSNHGPLTLQEGELRFEAPAGRVHRAQLTSPLASGEEITLALDSFEPAPRAGVRPTGLVVAWAKAGGGRDEQALPLR